MNGSLQIQAHVRAMIDADGAVLFDLKHGKYYSLNGVGARIWSKAQEGCRPSEILDHLRETFQAPAENLQRDLATFINGLAEKGLLHVSS